MQELQAGIVLRDAYISSIESQHSTQPDDAAGPAPTASEPANSESRIDNDRQPGRALPTLLAALTVAMARSPAEAPARA